MRYSSRVRDQRLPKLLNLQKRCTYHQSVHNDNDMLPNLQRVYACSRRSYNADMKRTSQFPIGVGFSHLRYESKGEHCLIRPLAKILRACALGVVGLSLLACDQPKEKALFRAAWNGDSEQVLKLVSEGVDVNAREAGSYDTPLHYAAQQGQTSVAGLLIDKGADVHAVNSNGNSPLSLAARMGHTDTARLLIDRGASVNEDEAWWEKAPLHDAGSPLYEAAGSGHTDTILLLIDRGASVNTADRSGCTPLHAAAGRGRTDAARILLEHGADAEDVGQGSCEFTPLHEAAWNGYTDTVRLLLEHGARVDATDGNGRTALHLAAGTGYADVVRVLIASGADRRAGDGWGRTALDIATAEGKEECAKLLRETREKRE